MWVGNHKEQWKEKLIVSVTDRTTTGHGFSIIMQVGNDRVEEDLIVCKKTALSDKELEQKEIKMSDLFHKSMKISQTDFLRKIYFATTEFGMPPWHVGAVPTTVFLEVSIIVMESEPLFAT